MSIPHEYRPFKPGTRVVVQGKNGEGYTTGGFSLMGVNPPFQLYIQIYWVSGGGVEAAQTQERHFDAFRMRSRCTSEPVEHISEWRPGEVGGIPEDAVFRIPGRVRKIERNGPVYRLPGR